MHLWVKKLKIVIFSNAPRQNSPQVLIINPPSQQEITYFPQEAFFLKIYSHNRKWWGEEEEMKLCGPYCP